MVLNSFINVQGYTTTFTLCAFEIISGLVIYEIVLNCSEFCPYKYGVIYIVLISRVYSAT